MKQKREKLRLTKEEVLQLTVRMVLKDPAKDFICIDNFKDFKDLIEDCLKKSEKCSVEKRMHVALLAPIKRKSEREKKLSRIFASCEKYTGFHSMALDISISKSGVKVFLLEAKSNSSELSCYDIFLLRKKELTYYFCDGVLQDGDLEKRSLFLQNSKTGCKVFMLYYVELFSKMPDLYVQLSKSGSLRIGCGNNKFKVPAHKLPPAFLLPAQSVKFLKRTWETSGEFPVVLGGYKNFKYFADKNFQYDGSTGQYKLQNTFIETVWRNYLTRLESPYNLCNSKFGSVI